MDQSQTYQLVAATLAAAILQKVNNVEPDKVVSDFYTPILQALLKQNPGKLANAAVQSAGFNG